MKNHIQRHIKKGEDKKARLIKEYNRLDQLNKYLNDRFDYLWFNREILKIDGETEKQLLVSEWRRRTFCPTCAPIEKENGNCCVSQINLSNIDKDEYTSVINKAMSMHSNEKDQVIAALIATADYFSKLPPTEDASSLCPGCEAIDYAKDFENKWVERCEQRYNLLKENYEIVDKIDIKCDFESGNKEKLQFSEEAERESANNYFDENIKNKKYGSVDNFLSEFMIKMYTKFMNKDGGAYGKVQSIIGNFSVTTDSYYSYPDCFIRLQSKDK
jgi:hypothetical protein